MRKYIRYARTGAKQQPKIAEEINWQLREITSYAYKHNLKIINTLTDIGSARASRRRGFEEMLRYIENGTVNGILCVSLDRLSRDFETSYLLYLLIKEGLEIVTPSKIYNKDTDDTLLSLVLLMSQFYNKTYSKHLSGVIKKGIRAKKKIYKKGG